MQTKKPNPILERHDIGELERASQELQAHIRARRPRRSRIRKFLGLAIGVGFTLIGAYLLVDNIRAERFLVLSSYVAILLFVGGMMLVYSEVADT